MDIRSLGAIILGLTSAVFSLPLIDTLSRGATFFVAHGATKSDILLFFACIFLALPVLIIFSFIAVRALFSPKVAKTFLTLVVGAGVCLWTMIFTSSLPTSLALAPAMVLGVCMALVFNYSRKLDPILEVFGYASVPILVSLIIFSPVKNLLYSEESSSRGVNTNRKPFVVMLVFDELSQSILTGPDGDIDSGRLPNFDRLKRISTWYSDTTTVSSSTHRAIPAILSGMRIHEDTLPVFSQFPQNLFTVFGDKHTVHAIESVSRLCPPSLCDPSEIDGRDTFSALDMYRDAWYVWLHTILPTDLAQKYLPTISRGWSGFRKPKSTGVSNDKLDWMVAQGKDIVANNKGRFTTFVSRIKGNSGTGLHYLHINLPHHPWIFLPDGTVYNGHLLPAETFNHDWKNIPELVEQAAVQYALQVEFADLLLGRLLDALENADILDDALLIVTSDHGLAVSPGASRRRPTNSTLADIYRVPLFIKYPQQKSGKRDSRRVETLDIFPTVSDVFEIKLANSVDGRSLISDSWKDAPRVAFEAGEDSGDFEIAVKTDKSVGKYHDIIEPGKSALEAIASRYSHLEITGIQQDSGPADPEFVLKLDNPDWYSDIALESGFLPVRLTGRIDGAKKGTQIVIALNDRLAGGSIVYDDQGSISVLLDPTQFRPGHNRIRSFTLFNEQLREFSLVGRKLEEWHLDIDERGVISAKDGRGKIYHRDTKKPDSQLVGSVSILRQSTSGFISGWATDKKLGIFPNEFLLIHDGRVVDDNFRRPIDRKKASNFWAMIHSGGFTIEIGPDLVNELPSISVLALWEDGRLFEITPQGSDKPNSSGQRNLESGLE